MDAQSLLAVASPAIRQVLGSPINGGQLTVEGVGKAESFDSIFNSAVGMIASTNDYLNQAAEAEVAYATGQMTNTHELAIIEQKANLSLQYTVAIKNQLLSAYKDIMNMQI